MLLSRKQQLLDWSWVSFSRIKSSMNRVIEEVPMCSITSNIECIHDVFCLNFTFPLSCLMGWFLKSDFSGAIAVCYGSKYFHSHSKTSGCLWKENGSLSPYFSCGKALAGSREHGIAAPWDSVSALQLEGRIRKFPSGNQVFDLSFVVLFREKDLISKELAAQAAGVCCFHL